jgi:hypothetical protein
MTLTGNGSIAGTPTEPGSFPSTAALTVPGKAGSVETMLTIEVAGPSVSYPDISNTTRFLLDSARSMPPTGSGGNAFTGWTPQNCQIQSTASNGTASFNFLSNQFGMNVQARLAILRRDTTPMAMI